MRTSRTIRICALWSIAAMTPYIGDRTGVVMIAVAGPFVGLFTSFLIGMLGVFLFSHLASRWGASL